MNRLPPFDFAQGREARDLYFREKAEGQTDAKFNWDITGEEMPDVLRFVFLELGRFRKRQMELETMYDKWLWLLGYMHELESIPENFTEPLFKRLFLLSELGEFTAEDARKRTR